MEDQALTHPFQEQASDDTVVMLDGFGTVVNALSTRTKPYLPQICGTIKWRLNNKNAQVRMQANVKKWQTRAHEHEHEQDGGGPAPASQNVVKMQENV